LIEKDVRKKIYIILSRLTLKIILISLIIIVLKLIAGLLHPK